MNANQHLSSHYASIYPSHLDANLVLVRQQRDLFSGGPSPTHLGIPDVTTHVGSVIHAFETLAHQRQMKEAEKPYESSKSTSSSNKRLSIHKIILPPPPPSKKISTGTLTIEPTKHIVRHRPKGRAPDIPTSSTNTASATTQTTVFSGDENESSALDSLNLEDETPKSISTSKFPQSYVVKNYKVLPPFVPPHQPSRIPTKAVNKQNNQSSMTASRNRMSDSLLQSSKSRTDVFLKPTQKHTEDDIENDFLRGTTVSQSFIKNVVRKSPTRKISTYEQNFLMNNDGPQTHVGRSKRKSLDRNGRSRSSGNAKIDQPLIDEVSRRYKEYSGHNNAESSKQYNFHPRSVDRAEL